MDTATSLLVIRNGFFVAGTVSAGLGLLFLGIYLLSNRSKKYPPLTPKGNSRWNIMRAYLGNRKFTQITVDNPHLIRILQRRTFSLCAFCVF